MSLPSTVRMFCCTICDELLGESTFSSLCGHMFHFDCIIAWLNRSATNTCRNCDKLVKTLIKLYPSDNEWYTVKTKEELDSLYLQLSSVGMSNRIYKSKVDDLISKLITSKDNIKQSKIDFEKLSAVYSDHLNCCNKTIINPKKDTSAADNKFNEVLSNRILFQKELYEYQSRNSAYRNQLKSEIEKLRSENAHFQSKYNDYTKPSTSSKNASRYNAVPNQMQSPELQPSPDGFLSNCHFWFVDEHKKVLGANNHLYFNQQRVKEHGGTIAHDYTNMVTHVIGMSQNNLEVIRGVNEGKKCVTDYWLSDVIAEKKIIKPWLAHHFPIPYNEDNLPYSNKKISIVNFDTSEYFKIKAMVEVTGASVMNNITQQTYIVISLNLEGEMIERASSLNIPVVNTQWINDILLGEKIDIQYFECEKYRQFNLPNSHMNYDKVSHLMEAWNERPNFSELELPLSTIDKSIMTNKKIKTCAIQEYNVTSDDNNSDGNNITSITSILATPTATEPCIMPLEYEP